MIIWVVEFSREGHKIRKMDKNKYSQKKLFYFCELASCQKRPNSDFQSQFSTSKKKKKKIISFKNINLSHFVQKPFF